MTVGKYYDMEDTPMKETAKKPEWRFAPYVSYELAHWLYTHRVQKLEYELEMTSADTSKSWIMMTSTQGEKHKLPGFNRHITVDGLNYGTLVMLDSAASQNVKEIVDWEIRHAKKIEEFKALKKELGL